MELSPTEMLGAEREGSEVGVRHLRPGIYPASGQAGRRTVLVGRPSGLPDRVRSTQHACLLAGGGCSRLVECFTRDPKVDEPIQIPI